MPVFDNTKPVPTAIGRIVYTLVDDQHETPPAYEVRAWVELRDDDGAVVDSLTVQDLIPHLLDEEIAALVSMGLRWRALAESELLG